ncbi:MAG: DUF1905 domain-containing protein [Erythrobacter sp.]
MTQTVSATIPLTRWSGERGTYHLVVITGEQAEAITMHARLHRLEFGRQRGFGSVKVVARIGETQWKSSVFPQKDSSALNDQAKSEGPNKKSWIFLVSKKVMRSEDLSEGDPVTLQLDLL